MPSRTPRPTPHGYARPPRTSPCKASWPTTRPELARGQEPLLDGHRRLADAQTRYSTGISSRLPTTSSA